MNQPAKGAMLQREGVIGLTASRFLLQWIYEQERILHQLEDDGNDENPFKTIFATIDPIYHPLYRSQEKFFQPYSLSAFGEILEIKKQDFQRLLLTKQNLINLLLDIKGYKEYLQLQKKQDQALGIDDYIKNIELLLPPNEYIREPLSSITIEDLLMDPTILFTKDHEEEFLVEESIDQKALEVWNNWIEKEETSLYMTVNSLIPRRMRTWRILTKRVRNGLKNKKLNEHDVYALQEYLTTLTFSMHFLEVIDEYFIAHWFEHGYEASQYLISHPYLHQKEMITAFLFVYYHKDQKDNFFNLHPHKAKRIIKKSPYLQGLHHYFWEISMNTQKKLTKKEKPLKYYQGIITGYAMHLAFERYLNQVKQYEINEDERR